MKGEIVLLLAKISFPEIQNLSLLYILFLTHFTTGFRKFLFYIYSFFCLASVENLWQFSWDKHPPQPLQPQPLFPDLCSFACLKKIPIKAMAMIATIIISAINTPFLLFFLTINDCETLKTV